jgi:hypothetical protein
MSQGKQNKFLIIYFSILGAGALILGYLGWSASSDADDAEKKYKDNAATLDRLENAPLSRTKENAKEKKDRVDKYESQVRELNTGMMAFQPPLNPTESNESFQKKLSEASKAVKDNAVARGVKLDAKFDLGMGNYLSAFPVSGAAPRLSAELDGIVYLVNTAMDAGVTSIDMLTREMLPFETEKAESKKPTAPLSDIEKKRQKAEEEKKAKEAKAAGGKAKAPVVGPDESKVLERQPMEITVTGKNQSILNFLQALANSSPDKAPHFFTIRLLRVENNEKDGPQKSVTVERKEVQPDPDNKATAYFQDAMFLLGNENVKLHLDLDLIRFLDLPAPPAEKTAPGKAADKPGAKPKAPAPASTPTAPASTPTAPASTPTAPASTPTAPPAPAPANQ